MAPLTHNKFYILCRDDCQMDNLDNWKPPSNFMTCWSQENVSLITGRA